MKAELSKQVPWPWLAAAPQEQGCKQVVIMLSTAELPCRAWIETPKNSGAALDVFCV